MLFHILIIVLALLPDFVISVLRNMRENLHLQQFDSKGDQDDMTVKFEAKNRFKQLSSEDCKLERFHELKIVEDTTRDGLLSNNNFKSKKSDDVNSTINPLSMNCGSNKAQQIDPSPRPNEFVTYDNPSFENDVSLETLSSDSSQL